MPMILILPFEAVAPPFHQYGMTVLFSHSTLLDHFLRFGIEGKFLVVPLAGIAFPSP